MISLQGVTETRSAGINVKGNIIQCVVFLRCIVHRTKSAILATPTTWNTGTADYEVTLLEVKNKACSTDGLVRLHYRENKYKVFKGCFYQV